MVCRFGRRLGCDFYLIKGLKNNGFLTPPKKVKNTYNYVLTPWGQIDTICSVCWHSLVSDLVHKSSSKPTQNCHKVKQPVIGFSIASSTIQGSAVACPMGRLVSKETHLWG
jgi:hypothetical protein